MCVSILERIRRLGILSRCLGNFELLFRTYQKVGSALERLPLQSCILIIHTQTGIFFLRILRLLSIPNLLHRPYFANKVLFFQVRKLFQMEQCQLPVLQLAENM